MPDAVWPVGRHPPDSSRDRKEPPVSTSTVSFRHFISGLLAFAFLTHTWRAHGTPFPTTLTTTALDRSSSGWFAASACTTTAEGHPATTAGLLHLLHSTASSGLVFYIQPPSTFVFTPSRGKQDATGSRAGPAPCSLLAQSGHVSRGVGRDRILWEQVAAAFTRQHHESDHRCPIGGVIGAVA